MLAGVTVTLTGCGSDSPVAPTPVTDKTGVIESNHGHQAVITSAQQTAGGALTINIQGTSGHDHTLELTGPEVALIRGGFLLIKQSNTARNHMHTVTFNQPAA